MHNRCIEGKKRRWEESTWSLFSVHCTHVRGEAMLSSLRWNCVCEHARRKEKRMKLFIEQSVKWISLANHTFIFVLVSSSSREKSLRHLSLFTWVEMTLCWLIDSCFHLRHLPLEDEWAVNERRKPPCDADWGDIVKWNQFICSEREREESSQLELIEENGGESERWHFLILEDSCIA